MSKTITGRAVVHGVSGDITYTGLAAEADQIPTGMQYEENGNLEKNLDGQGELVGFVATMLHNTCTINFYPTAVSTGNTLANAAKAMLLPSIPSKVTLTGFTEPSTNYLNGEWIYEGGGQIQENAGVAQMTLPLNRYPSSAFSSASLCTAVS